MRRRRYPQVPGLRAMHRGEQSHLGRSRIGLPRRIVWLLVALIVLQTWVLEGFPVPCRVTGGSMACTLLGEHCQLTCPDCGYTLVCQLDGRADDRRAVCPNCGYAFDVPEAPGVGRRSRFD